MKNLFICVLVIMSVTFCAHAQSGDSSAAALKKIISANQTVTTTPMRIGTNLWNFGWGHGWSDYVKPSLDWTTVTNPWLSGFLTDLAPFNGPIRFMDWGIANGPIIHWSDRIQKTDNHYNGKTFQIDASITKYFGSTSSDEACVAYEWMIDLCNRTGKDMWVTVPVFSDTSYWSQLAQLIHDNLDSNLKCYVEYSDETWNGGMVSFQYTIDQGVSNSLPGDNQWYKGGAWSVWNSLKIFKAFQNVFGIGAMGSRIIRVLAFSGNFDIADQAFYNVIYDGTGTTHFSPTWNPNNQKADLFAIAPYYGPNDDAAGTGVLDGAAANIADRVRANIDRGYDNYIQSAVTIAAKYNTKLGCYEGGQQLGTNADQWSSNPDIYDSYIYMLNKWIPANLVMFNHYTLYSTYSSSQAWGAKESVTTPLANAPKYKALVDWVNATTGSHIINNSPKNYALDQNFPNPFNPSTTISFSVGTYGYTSLKIFDILGREIKTLVNEVKSPGTYNIQWDGKNSAGQKVGSGVYFYQFKTESGFSKTQKMILLN